MSNSNDLIKAIDADEGLKGKRKFLTVTSIILLALSFTGAQVQEANTFILKLKFANQNGLGILFVLSILFLMVRYYNYAKPYHDKLYERWTKRLLAKPHFYSHCPHSDEDDGIVADSRCSELDAHYRQSDVRWDYSYKCGKPFVRYLVHVWGYNQYEDEDRMEQVNIYSRFGFKIYLVSIWLEAKEQFKSFFTHRENLDILAPYLLGIFAIASYYFSAELLKLLALLSPTVSK